MKCSEITSKMEGSLKGVKFISVFSEMTSRYYLKEVSGVVIQEGVMNATFGCFASWLSQRVFDWVSWFSFRIFFLGRNSLI